MNNKVFIRQRILFAIPGLRRILGRRHRSILIANHDILTIPLILPADAIWEYRSRKMNGPG